MELANPAEHLERLYLEELGRYHCITATENKRLVNSHKIAGGETWRGAYALMQIALVQISPDELKQVRRRNAGVIDGLLQKCQPVPIAS